MLKHNLHGLRIVYAGFIVALAAIAGCCPRQVFFADGDRRHFESVATKIDEPEVCVDGRPELLGAPPPNSVRRCEPAQSWPLTLAEAIQLTLANSRVIRDAGGRVVSSPGSVPTVYDTAIAETDPRQGVESALAQFDAQFNAGVSWQRQDHQMANPFLGGLPPGFTILDLLSGKVPPTLSVLNEDSAAFYAQVDKYAATGTQFSLRSDVLYDKTNAFFGLTPAEYDAYFTAQVRQPLLQGAGIEFNRIAGPLAQPGVYNGVLLARLNTDITLADFEASVVDLLFQVEQAYWELYFSYRDLDAKIAGRDAALETWRVIQKKLEAGTADEEQESRAREQYYLFDAQVINATNGVASANGPVLVQGGVYSNERRLRLLVGLAANDGRLIRPADEPTTAEAVFNWSDSVQQAFWRRVELRRQKWVIKHRDMELTASKNFLQGRLDLLAQYRWRGMGPDVLGTENSALDQILDGHYQDWQLGVQYSTPVGNRQGHAAVRNAELSLARERARYRELELEILDDASRAFGEVDRAYAITRSTCNRIQAAHRQLEEVRKKYDAGTVAVDFLLDAQQRVAEADSLYHRSLVDYTVSLAKVNRARGTLLDYYDVSLAEGPWCDEAYASAAKQARRFLPRVLDYALMVPPPVSRGPYAQQVPVAAGPADNNLSTTPPNPPSNPPPSGDLPEAIPAPLPLEPQGQGSPSPSGRG
jgi:outer membrane protein TolC